ncbi:MAG TPA: hypothetical protein VIM65_24115 [Cyclobacteriaceae bacterium]
MMRKFTVCLVLCATGLFVSSCNDDVSSPPKSTLAVDKTSGLSSDTEFTFTIDQVPGAGTTSLLPYGTENLSLGGINIPAASFTGGKATVKFKYAQVGKFQAVVVTNNHSADGKSVKNSYSNTIEITITSPNAKITDFSFDKISTKTTIDQDAKTIEVVVPYKTTLTALKATFTNDAFSTVTVGSTVQVSGSTANDFTNPVTYKVTANNGTDINNYVVTVVVTPSNNTFTFKSFGGKEVSTAATSTLGASLATSGTDLILYDVYQTPSTSFDSVTFSYALDNPFGVLHYGSEVAPMKQDRRIDLTSTKTVKLMAQDSATTGGHAFNIYAVDAPLLLFTTTDPVPDIVDVNTGFVALVKALKGTVTDSKIDLDFNVTAPSNVSIVSITLKDASNPGGVTVSNGGTHEVDFSDAVTVTIRVTDNRIGGLTYDVVYTAGLTELK